MIELSNRRHMRGWGTLPAARVGLGRAPEPAAVGTHETGPRKRV